METNNKVDTKVENMEEHISGVTFETSVDTTEMEIQGQCMTWNILSSDRGGYRVRLLPNSAKFSDNTRLIYSHNFADTLCICSDQSLQITADDKGVSFEAELPPTTVGKDVYILLSLNRINGCSFRAENINYRTVKEGGESIQEFISFDVPEITITPIPAFEGTWVKVVTDDTDEEDETNEQPTDTVAGDGDNSSKDKEKCEKTAIEKTEISTELPAQQPTGNRLYSTEALQHLESNILALMDKVTNASLATE